MKSVSTVIALSALFAGAPVGLAAAQPFIFPLQEQRQQEPAPPRPSPVPVAPPQAEAQNDDAPRSDETAAAPAEAKKP